MPDSDVHERTMNVTNSKNQKVGGGNIALGEDIISDGNGGDVRARIERNDVVVDPEGGGGAVAGDGRNERIRDDEEERDVSVGESSDDVRIGDREADGGDL